MNSEQNQVAIEALPQEHARASANTRIEELVAQGHPIALYLDLDGTLLDVAPTPSLVHVPPHLAGLLASLAEALDGALAIVTGRRIEDADRLLAPFRSTAAGVHGAEVRTSPHEEINKLSPHLDEEIAASIQDTIGRIPGITLENKGAGLTLHYRLAPERKAELLSALDVLLPRHRDRFAICGGRKVVEVLPVGYSKARALRQIATLPRFAKRTPVMIGDDVSDEAAIIAAQDMGGYGLKVAGENFALADAHFGSPGDVLAWLTRIEHVARQSRLSRRQSTP